jgi:hypothetical protein
MIPISLSSKRLSLIVRLLFLVVGLVLMVASPFVLPEKLGALRITEIVTNMGAFVVATIAVQWVFDEKMRRELMSDVALHAIGNSNVARSGVCNFVDDTKQIDYSDQIQKSDTLVVGLHYSPRFVEDNFVSLRARVARSKSTIFLISADAEALRFLTSVRQESEHVIPNLRKIESLIGQINQNAKYKITVLKHNAILRYSFVLGDDYVWVKPYRNSFGMVKPPGLQVKSGSPFFEFYKQDIERLIAEAQNG